MNNLVVHLLGTIIVLVIHLGTLKWNVEREKITKKRSSPLIGVLNLLMIGLWAVYVFWYQGLKIGIICLIFYLVVSYFLEKKLGLNKVNTLEPWK